MQTRLILSAECTACCNVDLSTDDRQMTSDDNKMFTNAGPKQWQQSVGPHLGIVDGLGWLGGW